MKLDFLDEGRFGDALEVMLMDPYGNAPLVASLTEFKNSSLFVYATDRTGMRGLLSMSTGLVSPVTAVWYDDVNLLRPMLAKLASRCRRVRDGFIWCLGGKRTLGLLEETTYVECVREEVQMKLDLHSFDRATASRSPSEVVSLSADNLSDLNALYELVPPDTWRSEDVLRGPYRGAYEGGQLAAAAGVHWVTPWIAEVGNVAVHPEFRRRGLAEACVAGVVSDLKQMTERVYLMVVAENEAAINLYHKMGFEEVRRMWLVGFRGWHWAGAKGGAMARREQILPLKRAG